LCPSLCYVITTDSEREKLTGRLLTLDPALGPTLLAFQALLEVPVEDPSWQVLDPAQRRQRTLDALKRLLLRESQVQPLLLVFENLHWIDAETQAFLDGLVESLPAACLLLLVNYRPEYQHGWGQKTYYTQLRLDPLPPASSEDLFQSLLGDDQGLERLKQRLIERIQGNPQTAAVIGTEVPLPLLQAIAAAQRALALATARGEVALHAQANYYLGLSYKNQGNHPWAIDCFGQTVASLKGAGHHESFGQALLPAVSSRAYLAESHAELGTFAEGRVLGEGGLRIAETGTDRGSLIFAHRGVGLLALHQGDLPRALPPLERAVGVCQEAGFSAWFPVMAAPLGEAYTLSGRVADAVPLLMQALDQVMARDEVVFQAMCALALDEPKRRPVT
jgi:tetratricopeptide (TPR) repeat protein